MKKETTKIDPITVSVADASKMLGIGYTSLWELISSGKIRTKTFGRRRLIEVKSLQEFVYSLPDGSVEKGD